MEASFDTQHNSTDVRRAVYRLSSKFWPNARVPYVIDTSLGKCSAHLEARAAMIPEHTCPPQAQEHASPLPRQSKRINEPAVSDLCKGRTRPTTWSSLKGGGMS